MEENKLLNIVTRVRYGRQRSGSRQGQIFSLRPDQLQSSYPANTGAVFAGVERLERQAEHLTSSIAEVKNTRRQGRFW
jgi:hypothetical protein